MPALTSATTIVTYSSASSLPESVWTSFRSNARNANIMDAHAQKALIRERAGEPPSRDELWIVCFSNSPQSTVDFILSCTNGPLGKYPIFIFTPHPYHQLTEDFVRTRIQRLIHALLAVVPLHRVYSIFAPHSVAITFAELWSAHTGVPLDEDPEYYAALLTYCTRKSFVNRQMTINPELAYEIRPAVEDDILEAAELCHGFAAEAEPFTLTNEGAIQEATHLVHAGQLWVHRVQQAGGEAEIASIVATTRESESVTGITKVYTSPRWRARGCAERLVRRVVRYLLKTKESVVLYVAHENPAAKKVYHRIGFGGLNGKEVDGVEPWLELGFDRSVVDLGHW